MKTTNTKVGPVMFGLTALLASYATSALAKAPFAPFAITSPPGGSVISPGQAVTVQWTGGDPSWLVDVYLIELTPGFPFAAVAVPASHIPNGGIVSAWPFPSNIDYGAFHYNTCGHTYQFYVQEVNQISYTYGPVFTVSASGCAPVCPPPTITAVASSPGVLWPPNHAMIPVTVSAVTSGGCGGVSCKVTSVSSNEPNGSDALATGEAVIAGNLTLNLRATRLGNGSGRIYTITVQCTDADNSSTTKAVSVIVPHDQGK